MRRLLPTDRLQGLFDPTRALTQAEVAARRARFGANDILGNTGSGWLTLLKDTLKDPMLWFLLGTSGLYLLLGDLSEAMVLLAALVPLLGMDAWLHRRTQASTESLARQLSIEVTVVRESQPMVVPATELVPGDLVDIFADQYAPADGLLVAGDGVQIDESALTGEAYPVRKRVWTATGNAADNAADKEVDEAHWLLAGTRVLTGVGRLRITHTGAETLYGEIVRSAQEGAHAQTPLQQAIARLVGILLGAALVLCALLAFIRWYQGHGWLDALLSAVTLAVAALPEEFPVVFTFFLGVGVYRLARRRALVRRAVVVENIGRITAICSDKTGTLTEGRLELTHRLPAEGVSDEELLRVAVAASDPDTQDPLDAAILALSKEQPDDCLARYPFTEDRRRAGGVHRTDTGQLRISLKGAPETVLAMSSLSMAAQESWLAKVAELAGGAHKVIACAAITVPEAAWQGDEPECGYDFLGLLAFEDPVREGVVQAITTCREAGIHVVMITGDHPLTAAAIGREVGLGDAEPRVVLANAFIEELSTHPERAREVDVIARAIPAQKVAVVRALQSVGDLVAVTGDGVNDVPALQAADVGIAMGKRGSQSAQEVASIVLTDDNFSSLVRAIAEGQQLFTNLKLSFAYLLMIHLPLVLSAALIPLVGYELLYLPVHIVWLELIIHPTALLVFQQLSGSHRLQRNHLHHDFLQRNLQHDSQHDSLPSATTRRRIAFFSNAEWLMIVLIGGVITGILMVAYLQSIAFDQNVAHARGLALAILAVASAVITAALSRLSTTYASGVVLATLIITFLLLQVPPVATLLKVAPLTGADGLILLGVAMVVGVLALLSPLSGPSHVPKSEPSGT